MTRIAALISLPMLLGFAGVAHAQLTAQDRAGQLGTCANGCLVLVNDSENSDITALFLHDGHSTPGHRFNVHWNESVFRPRQSGAELAIYPHKAWWMPITSDMPCEIRIGVNFRDRTTHKLRTGPEGNVNICDGKHSDVVFRAKEASPEDRAKG